MENKIQLHYQDALNKFPKSRIIGVFCQGSQNYGLDDENSDLDSKCLFTPSIDDYHSENLINLEIKTYIREDSEHIVFTNLYNFIRLIKEGSPNYLELLYSKINYVNPIYQDFWNKLVAQREALSRYNPKRIAKSMNRMIQGKYQNLCQSKTYPTRMYMIENYQYDSKELSHLIRMYYTLYNYVNWNKSFQDCLLLKLETEEETNDIKNWIIDIKRNPSYSFDEALKIAKDYANKANQLYKKFAAGLDWNENYDLRNYLNILLKDVEKISIQAQESNI